MGRITQDAVMSWARSTIVPANSALVIAGKFDPALVKKHIAYNTDQISAGSHAAPIADEVHLFETESLAQFLHLCRDCPGIGSIPLEDFHCDGTALEIGEQTEVQMRIAEHAVRRSCTRERVPASPRAGRPSTGPA